MKAPFWEQWDIRSGEFIDMADLDTRFSIPEVAEAKQGKCRVGRLLFLASINREETHGSILRSIEITRLMVQGWNFQACNSDATVTGLIVVIVMLH